MLGGCNLAWAMANITTLFRNRSLSVIDYRCTATPSDKPFTEQHSSFSLSFVRKGSFGCRTAGKLYELVPGSLMIGCSGDEYMCTHEHHAYGDECLSFAFAPSMLEESGAKNDFWRLGVLPPRAEIMVLGQLAQLTADGRTGMCLDEIGLLILIRFVELASDQKRWCSHGRPQTRRRLIEAALCMEAESGQPLSLDQMASWLGVSKYQFLRAFMATLGLTPHQYLMRCRIRRAVELLADADRKITDIALDVGFDDLSNFIRTFRRSAGVSPREFRQRANGRLLHRRGSRMTSSSCALRQ